jgi:hypothetical protein
MADLLYEVKKCWATLAKLYLDSSSMGVEAASLAHPPATQDITGIVYNRHCNQKSDSESNFGQVQTHKVPLEAPSIFMGKPDTIMSNREKYALQDQTTKVASEAINFFLIGRCPCGTIMCSAKYKSTLKR